MAHLVIFFGSVNMGLVLIVTANSFYSSLCQVLAKMAPVFVSYLFLLNGIHLALGSPPSFSCVSWNVNGAEKLKNNEHALGFLGSFDIILLQETYSGSRETALDLHGYIPHHQLGRQTLRRYQWGLTTLLRIDAFTNGVICRIHSPFDWLLVSRWRTEMDLGLVIINIYHPVHSNGFGQHESDSAVAFLRALRDDFPGDAFVMGGDLNVDRWRINELRRTGQIIPSNQRLVLIDARRKNSVLFSISFFGFLFKSLFQILT